MSPEAAKKLQNYDSFHKNFINKVIHYVGIPLIVYSTIALFSVVGKGHYNLALPLIALVTYYYWRSMGKTTAFCFLIAAAIFYAMSAYIPLGYNIGIFVFGWVMQIAGHAIYEKNSPAFMKNFEHLLMGPAWFVNKFVSNKV